MTCTTAVLNDQLNQVPSASFLGPPPHIVDPPFHLPVIFHRSQDPGMLQKITSGWSVSRVCDKSVQTTKESNQTPSHSIGEHGQLTAA